MKCTQNILMSKTFQSREKEMAGLGKKSITKAKITTLIDQEKLEEVLRELDNVEEKELGLLYYETRPIAKKIEQIFRDLVFKVLIKDTSSSEKDRRRNGGD